MRVAPSLLLGGVPPSAHRYYMDTSRDCVAGNSYDHISVALVRPQTHRIAFSLFEDGPIPFGYAGCLDAPKDRCPARSRVEARQLELESAMKLAAEPP